MSEATPAASVAPSITEWQARSPEWTDSPCPGPAIVPTDAEVIAHVLHGVHNPAVAEIINRLAGDAARPWPGMTDPVTSQVSGTVAPAPADNAPPLPGGAA